VDNSIGLKDLHVINGVLKKGDQGLKFCFYFSKGFFFG
jgi:hypothetical protein